MKSGSIKARKEIERELAEDYDMQAKGFQSRAKAFDKLSDVSMDTTMIRVLDGLAEASGILSRCSAIHSCP